MSSFFQLFPQLSLLTVVKASRSPPCLSCCHLRMSMKEGVWVMLATIAPRLVRRMKGSTRWLQADSQEPAGTVPPPATQLQLV